MRHIYNTDNILCCVNNKTELPCKFRNAKLKCLLPADEILGGYYESGPQHAGPFKVAMGKVMNHKVGSQNTVVVATSTRP
jgi:hypothetical protein